MRKHFAEENILFIFLNTLSDSDAEHAETDVWLDFAFSRKFTTETEHKELNTDHEEVGRIIDIIKNPQKYM